MLRAFADKGMIRSKEQVGFFAAANTADGFVSFFDEVFFSRAIKRRYIIKGGPGTGKSSLMRRIARHAADRGLAVEYYYCSSDTDSLDGIVIDSRIALFDGTAPHSYDTSVAGARDELVNLGEFWDSAALRGKVREIEVLGERKKRAYREAYGYLFAARSIRSVADSAVLSAVDLPKLAAAVERSYARLEIPKGSAPSVLTRQTHALGVHGEVELLTLARSAARAHLISDHYGTAYLYLRELERLVRERGGRVAVSRDPLDLTRVQSILFLDTGDFFAVSDFAERDERVLTVNMKRFVDAAEIGKVRFSYRTAMRACSDVKALALAALSEAGEAHAELEKIYVPCMDFERQSAYSLTLADKILASTE